MYLQTHIQASFTNNSSVYNTNQITSSINGFINNYRFRIRYSIQYEFKWNRLSKFNIVPQNSNTSSVQLTHHLILLVELIHILHQFLTNLVKHHNMKEKLQLPVKFRNFNNKWNILYYRIKLNITQIKTNSNGRTEDTR